MLDDVEVVVDGDTASVEPVAIRSATGGGVFEFTMRRELDGVWRCVSIAGAKKGHLGAQNARSVRERILGDRRGRATTS